MVNTGRPSLGCLRCRRRKVRCDLTVPGCTRCLALGQQCPGYPDRATTSLTFKDSTDATRVRARRIYSRLQEDQRKAPSSSSKTHVRRDSTRPPDEDAVALDMQSLSSLREFIITGAVCSFASHWRDGSTLLFDGNFHLAGNMYPNCSPCLQAAVETYALWAMALDKSSSMVALHTPVLQTYGRALRLINHAITHFDTSNADHLLLAIELVAIFEVRTAFRGLVQPAALGHLQRCQGIVWLTC